MLYVFRIYFYESQSETTRGVFAGSVEEARKQVEDFVGDDGDVCELVDCWVLE